MRRLLFFFIAVFLFFSCGRNELPPQSEFVLGTICSLNLFDEGTESLYAECFSRLRELHGIFNNYSDSSEISAVNQSAADAPVSVSEDFYIVLKTALDFAELTGGAFDPTVGPLVKAWGFGKMPHVPSPEELEAARALVGWQNVLLDEEESEVQQAQGFERTAGAVRERGAVDEAGRIGRAAVAETAESTASGGQSAQESESGTTNDGAPQEQNAAISDGVQKPSGIEAAITAESGPVESGAAHASNNAAVSDDNGTAARRDENHTVRFKKPGVALDLGAIAKGYAADELVRILNAHKVRRASISLGGNVYVYGKKPGGELWNVGIRDPAAPEENAFLLKTKNATVVTSGGYERFFEEDGKIYGHIINPATGFPAESGLVSVTIVSQKSMTADALSTSLFVLGMEGAVRLQKTPGSSECGAFECLLVGADGSARASQGLKGKIQPLKGQKIEYF